MSARAAIVRADSPFRHAADLHRPGVVIMDVTGTATLLLYAGPALLFGYCLRGLFVRRRDQVYPLAAVGATLLVALHALVDFSLQIPAVAVTYAALFGLGVAQATPGAKRPPEPGASLRD